MQALKEFTSRLSLPSRVLTTSNEAFPPGVTAEALAGDPRFFSPKKESYEGIWAPRLLSDYTADECRRVLAIFFAATKPKGLLYLSWGSKRYSFGDIASLVRQHGYRLLLEGKIRESDPGFGEEFSVLAQRL